MKANTQQHNDPDVRSIDITNNGCCGGGLTNWGCC
jgi:hypothetical protein